MNGCLPSFHEILGVFDGVSMLSQEVSGGSNELQGGSGALQRGLRGVLEDLRRVPLQGLSEGSNGVPENFRNVSGCFRGNLETSVRFRGYQKGQGRLRGLMGCLR